MIERLKPYAQYNHPTLPWLNAIPSYWEMIRDPLAPTAAAAPRVENPCAFVFGISLPSAPPLPNLVGISEPRSHRCCIPTSPYPKKRTRLGVSLAPASALLRLR
jgi:hypothetical protein